MKLQFLDWIIVIASLLVCFLPALFFGRRAGRSTTEFFVSGRAVPWWLAGFSMVATTFSSDTPNWVTEQVRRFGVAGNWQWWAFALTGVATVFFFARLWRRSGVMTDLEFYELRYSGRAASVVRGFRAVYLGLFFNCCIMATVTLAACKIANILFGLPPWQTILVCGLLSVVFASHSGLWGVLVIDMLQFFIMMGGVIAAAYFSVQAVGGLDALITQLSELQVTSSAGGEPVMVALDGRGQPILDLLPNFALPELAVMIFIMPVAVGWWANWYPGSEPGGGSYIAQRMLASRSEKDALGGVLFFNLAHYVLRPWPWILTALCSIIIFPDLASIHAAFPDADPRLIGHDSAFPAMLKFLPVGFVGLMVGGLIAANTSTILTHLNWGSSYLVHDFYRRFLQPHASERHYVNVGRVCTVGLYAFAAWLSTLMTSAQQAFQLLLSIGAGTGLIYLARWFWWRVSAWCEVVAMAASLLGAAGFPWLQKLELIPPMGFALTTTLQVVFTTLCWLLAAYLAPATDRAQLIAFYRKVRPAGPGWSGVREAAGVTPADAARSGDRLGVALIGWLAGCGLIWSSLFALGNFLYGRNGMALILSGVVMLTGLTLLYVIKHLWQGQESERG